MPRIESESTVANISWSCSTTLRYFYKEVKNPHLIETGYQSPQLKLLTFGPDEWLLFLKLPDYAARKKPGGALEVIQLLLLVMWEATYAIFTANRVLWL